MDGTASLPLAGPTLRRAFELCRAEQQLLALAYEQLLPIIRSPRPPRQAPLACTGAGRRPSFQEEQDIETP